MSVLVNDATIAAQLLQRRRASGLDRFDEVWDGVYVMSPLADNEHQALATQLAAVLVSVIDWKGLGRTLAGANISDRQADWTHNYRVPDVLVFLGDTLAEDRGTHWLGGPEFAIEIVSPGDQTLAKLGFYASVGTRELLVIDRDPWRLTLYRQADGVMIPASVSDSSGETTIWSEVLPIGISLCATPPCLRLFHTAGQPLRDIPIPRRP